MALPTSGQISMGDIITEKDGQQVNVSMQGLHLDGIVDDGNVDRTLNTDSILSENHGGPNGSTSDGGHKASEFYGYDHDFRATSFNGTAAGSVSTFSTNTSTSVYESSGWPNFDLNINSNRASSFWEMQHTKVNGNSPAVEANVVQATRIGNDKTNKRIMILLMKDGDNSTLAGGGSNAGYILIPYVGLEDATWTYSIEYDTSDSGFRSGSGINRTRGNPSVGGTYTTSSTYSSVPTNTNETLPQSYASIPSFTGMANTGESLITEGSSHLASWVAKVPSNNTNIAMGVGTSDFFSGNVGVRYRIKAVLGSDTYTAVSNYWNLALKAQRGTGF